MGSYVIPRRKLYSGIIAMAAAIPLLVVMFSSQVGAISDIGPDPSSHGGQNPMYTLENTPEVRVTDIQTPIYIPSRPSGNVAVEVFGFKYPFGRISNHLTTTINGTPLTGNMTLWIAPSGFVYDQDTGYYKTTVTAAGRGGDNSNYRNATGFRLRVHYGGGLIGTGSGQQYSTASGTYFTNPRTARFDNYAIEFASPCNLSGTTRQAIELQDLDSGHADNRGRSIGIRIQDMTTGSIWTPYWSGGTGNGQTAHVYVDFQPGHKYRLLLSNVDSDNTLIYKFPYDNIAYALACQPPPNYWTVNGQSYIYNDVDRGVPGNPTRQLQGSDFIPGNVTAKPGDRLYFKHDLRVENGYLDRDFAWTLRGDDFIDSFGRREFGQQTALWHNSGRVTASQNSLFLQLGSYSGGNASYTVYDVSQDDVNKSLCQWLEWAPGSHNTNSGNTDMRCATVPYNYTLTPTVALDKREVSASETLGVTGAVANSGPTKSKSAEWRFSYLVIDSGVSLPAAAVNGSSPCDYYRAGGRTCESSPSFSAGGDSSASGAVFASRATETFIRSALVNDLEVGKRVCYGLSVKDAASNNSGWAHSAVVCAVLSKRPVVQVLGNDLIVGRGKSTTVGSIVSTNIKNASGTQYGAWAEYGIMPSGLVSGMASASGYAGGVSARPFCGVSYLTISNAATGSCTDTAVGRYSFSESTPAVASRFPTTGAQQLAGDVSIDSLTSGQVYTSNSANATIQLTATPARIPGGKWFVINAPNATVRIANNIMYTDTDLGSIKDIPQVIIIARNIIINDTVTQVDAWLVAQGTGADGVVNTCDAPGSVAEPQNLNATVCAAPLTINGPVIANRLLMHRTAGAGAREDSGDPAEVFNLRPDAYMWASAQQSVESKARTVMTTELPPRF